MLRALLDDCSRIDTLTVSILIDWRCQAIADSYVVTPIVITADTDVIKAFQGLLDKVDAVWLVAPEFLGILQNLTEQVEAAGKRLLTSSAAAVTATADKWRSFQVLEAAGIPTVNTALITGQLTYRYGSWVIKPVDGVGCISIWLVESAQDFAETLARLDNPENFIIQPFIAGRAMSLSCLFYQGQGWVLCVNEQVLSVQDRNFKLLGCKVNSFPVTPEIQQLVIKVAQAIPGLHGYVGIDFIQTQDEIENWIVEINPRLTSSYVGIYQALGLNIVRLVLAMGQQVLDIQPVCNVQVDITLS